MYRPIEPMDAQAAERPMSDAEQVRRRWADLRDSAGEARVRVAVDGERWRAAVETGVIERLYEVSRGVTEAIVRHGLEADETDALDQPVYDQIAAHRHAEDLVFDTVHQERPVTTSLIRELHAAVTAAQESYTARDPFDRRVRRRLAHGHYKDHDNSVRLPDGTLHEYAPAAQTPAEMDRLVAMIEATGDVHPVRVAAFAHHRFTQVHPFQDGNGRTARLLASLLLVRGGHLSFVVDRGDRDHYLRALREADEDGLLGFVDFVVARQRDVLLRVEQATFAPAAATSLRGLSEALAEYAARRRAGRRHADDPERDVVQPLGAVLERSVRDALSEALRPFRDRGFDTDTELFPFELSEENAYLRHRVPGAGPVAAEGPRVGRLEAGFRIGDRDERRVILGVVALRTPGGGEAALVLEDVPQGTFRQATRPALTVTAETVNEREVRRWVDEWLGEVLVDYAQRL